MEISRRDVLAGVGALGLASPISAFGGLVGNDAKRRRVRFVHFTDLHIEPELGAPDGVALAVQKLLSLHPRPDFVITGGDHIMDVLSVARPRADVQFKLLAEALKPLEMPVVSVIGNHDVYGWSDKAEDANDPLYGKKMIEERVLKADLYRSFDRDGYHFVLLDSLQASPSSDSRSWYGGIDDEQLTWLANDLIKAGSTPSIVVSHFPVMTLFTQYTDGTLAPATDALILRNGREVQAILAKHKVPLVLQGHTHVVEDCSYLGTRYITGGAVCGDWWKGWRLGVHPEGFMVYDLDGDQIKAQYVATGWKARV